MYNDVPEEFKIADEDVDSYMERLKKIQYLERRIDRYRDFVVSFADDGLTISNEFDLHMKEDIREALKEKDYEKIKSILGLCEVYGCHEYVSAGWHTKDGGYMRTCGDHHRELQPFMGKTKND